MISLFTNVPVSEALEIIKTRLNPRDYITELTRHCLNNTYFLFGGQLYKQVIGAPMGSLLSPVIANIFMMDLEEQALESAPSKQACG